MARPTFNLRNFDFLDLGSKKGGSILYCQERFSKIYNKNLKGIGVDINPVSVDYAIGNGFPSFVHDITKLKINNYKFKFISSLDFMEHLPNKEYVPKVVENISNLASDFLFIRHPSFEDLDYLKGLGLKIDWNDWSGHSAMMRVDEFTEIFNNLGLSKYCIVFRNPILSSDSPRIIPIDAPVDSHEYDKSMGNKKSFKFNKPIYAQIDMFVALKDIKKDKWNRIVEESIKIQKFL